MDENMFDVGLDVATLSADLPDPVITLSGADSYTVQGTADYPLLALNLYGKSTQGYASYGGTPLGKNLFDSTRIATQTNYDVTLTNNSDGTFSFTGTPNATAWGFTKSYTHAESIALISVGTYALSGCDIGQKSPYVFLNLYYNGKTDYLLSTLSTAHATAEITEEMLSYEDFGMTIGFWSNTNTTTFNGETYYIQLEKSDVATDFEPYYSNPNPDCPVDISVVGDDEKICITACAKNLYENTIPAGYTSTVKGITFTINTDGTITANGTSTGASTFYLRCKEVMSRFVGKDVIFNGCPSGGGTWDTYYVQTYLSDYTEGLYDCGEGILIPAWETDRTIIRIAIGPNVTLDNLVFKPMIRLAAESDDTYEPYKGATAEITAGLPLCSVGDVRDELVYNADGTGKIIKRTKQIIADGVNVTATFMSANTENGITQWRLSYDNALADSFTVNEAYCSHLKYSRSTATTNEHFWVCKDGSNIYVRCYVKSSIIGATTAEINAWLAAQNNAGTPFTVVAVLAEPQEIELSAVEMAALAALKSFEGVTNVFNDEQAEMAIKMLRSDYDMKYVEWLKESQTWICPKAGKWKVICVGGGASGGIYDCTTDNAFALAPTVAGGTTSFGSIVSADGGMSTSDYRVEGNAASNVTGGISGYGGYTGTSYGGVPSVAIAEGVASGGGNAAAWAMANPVAAVGYGAGGGAIETRSIHGIAGRAGAIESTIVDLEEGQSIVCTVGKGGESTDTAKMGSGADGVIVVQYLGY